MVVDPSHGTGHTYLVPDMAVASIAAGADGLILEIHPDPEKALSDGYQSLTFARFAPSAQPALVNGSAGAVSRAPDGRPFSVIGFTVVGGKIVEIDILADAERLNRLDLSALDD